MKKIGREINANKKLAVALGLLAATIFFLAIFFNFDACTFILSLLSIAGIYICISIILYSLGNSNSLAHRLCSADAFQNCNEVLNSKYAKLYGKFTLADLGLVYFIGLFLFLLLAMIYGMPRSVVPFLQLPVSLSFLATLISVWYQWRIIKAWCKMCLAVNVVIWLQSASLFIGIKQQNLRGNFKIINTVGLSTVLLFITSFLIASFWLLIKDTIAKADLSKKYRKQLSLFKYNPSVFIAMLMEQRHINVELWSDDVIIGNPKNELQVLIVINPYCNYCKTAHEQLDELLSAFPARVYTINRFMAGTKSGRKTKRITIALQHILHAFFSTCETSLKDKVLTDWFRLMNLKKWKKIYDIPKTEENIFKNLLDKYKHWNQNNSILVAPSIFINGYQLPQMYKINDLIKLLTLIKDFNPKKDNNRS